MSSVREYSTIQILLGNVHRNLEANTYPKLTPCTCIGAHHVMGYCPACGVDSLFSGMYFDSALKVIVNREMKTAAVNIVAASIAQPSKTPTFPTELESNLSRTSFFFARLCDNVYETEKHNSINRVAGGSNGSAGCSNKCSKGALRLGRTR